MISIASLRGRARGGGNEIALACDLRYASRENAILGQPEVPFGLLPAGGGIERLARLIGRARALEVIATVDDYDAGTAELYGWVHERSQTANSTRSSTCSPADSKASTVKRLQRPSGY